MKIVLPNYNESITNLSNSILKHFNIETYHNTIEELVKLGYKDMIIACLQSNPSNDFYKYMGGKFVDTSLFVLPNQELIENVYYYSNISELLN